MKLMRRVGSVIALIGLAAVVAGCAGGYTTPATNVTTTSGTLKGTISYAAEDYGTYHFSYAPVGGSWTTTPPQNFIGSYWGNPYCHSGTGGLTSQNVSANVSGLAPGTPYVYRIGGTACTAGGAAQYFDSTNTLAGTNYSKFVTTPTITGSTPASPSASNGVMIQGLASSASGTQVNLYDNATCDGSLYIAGTGTGATFSGTGLSGGLLDSDNSHTFSVDVTYAGVTSACSNAYTYNNQQTTIPAGNLTANPSFETDLSNWDSGGDGLARVTLPNDERHGSYVAKLNKTVSGNGAFGLDDSPSSVSSAQAGYRYLVSAFVRSNTVTSNAKSVTVELRHWSGAAGSSSIVDSKSSTQQIGGDWTRFQPSYTPATSGGEIDLHIVRPSPAGPSEEILIDLVTLTATPPRPTVSSTDPASPASSTSPMIKGTAPAGSTVKLYTNGSCAGSPVATGTAGDFSSTGIPVSVNSSTTTTFWANATVNSTTSDCSTTSVAYQAQ
jgi:hypothetical protein